MTKITELQSFTDQVINREEDAKQRKLAEFAKSLEEKLNTQKEQLTAKHEAQFEKVTTQHDNQFNIRLNSLQLGQRNKQLAIKQEIIDDYIKEVKTGFNQLNSDETIQFINHLLNQHELTEHSEIVLGEQTKKSIQDESAFSVRVNESIIPGVAGFILMDGDIEYNYLFDNLVEETRRQLQLILLDQVFNQDK